MLAYVLRRLPVALRVFDISGDTLPGDEIRWTDRFAFASRPGFEHTLRILPTEEPQ